MAAVEYTLDKLEAAGGRARIATLDNKVLSKKWRLPAVMFDVRTDEEMGAVRRHYFEGRPSEHILGFTVPLSRLPVMARPLRQHVPRNLALLCDIETEMLWWSNMKRAVPEFHRRHTITSDSAMEAIQRVASAAKFSGKVAAHKEMWEGWIANQRTLLPMLSRYVNLQNAHQADILSAFGPLLLDGNHIDLLEECFSLTGRLYGGASAGLEREGRQLALYANLHTQFLAKARNVPSLVSMVERAAPGALVFKIFNLVDIRKKPAFQANYEQLVESLSRLSLSMGMPVVYLSAHTEGYRANLEGIDAFSEPFNHESSTMRERGGAFKPPKPGSDYTEQSGKIYDIQTGDFVTREVFEGKCLTEDGVRSPVPGIAGTDPGHVRAMTDAAFREFSKALLMQSRNHEEAVLHEGIRGDDLDRVRLKIDRWRGAAWPAR